MKQKNAMGILAIAAAFVAAAIISSTGATPPPARWPPEPTTPNGVNFRWMVAGQPLGKTLADLAKMQGLNADNYLAYRRDMRGKLPFSKQEVIKIVVKSKTFGVAVQTAEDIGVPGTAGQQLVLITDEGKIIDRIQCEINCNYGFVATNVLAERADDGARIVMRFVGSPLSQWHYWHTIAFRHKFWTFFSTEGDAPVAWNKKGLCRLDIVNDRFVVVFPSLEIPNLAAARTLRITYHPGTLEKHLDVIEGNQVCAMLGAIRIKGLDRGVLGGWSRYTTVDFIMPDGTSTQWTFRKPHFLLRLGKPDELWGGCMLHLDSADFFNAVSKAVANAEGHEVALFRTE